MNVKLTAGRLRLRLPAALCQKPTTGLLVCPTRTFQRESVPCLPNRKIRCQAYVRRAMASAAPMVDQIKEKNEKYPVMIYAKSWCPFCGQVKGLFKKLQVDFTAVNLDEIHEGEEIQDELAGITGSHTVPQVFIKGEFIGGCDETMDLNRSGKLKEKLEKAGISAAF